MSMERSAVIEKSLSVFVCGFISLVPLAGLVAAAHCLYGWACIYFHYGRQWNPASRYLTAGFCLGIVSLIAHVLGAAIVFWSLIVHTLE